MRLLASTVLLGLLLATPLAGQWPPESFTNLEVLPEDIEQRALVDIMAGFTRALGVRCTYCHVGEESQPLSEYDFPSDEKVEKRKARVMLRMVRAINDAHLSELPDRTEPRLEVTCATCHRGVTRPRPLQAELVHAYDTGGIDSLSARYEALRERYYGNAAYDFGDVALADVASDIQRRDALTDAEAVHALNVRMNPDSRFAKRMHAGSAILLAFVESGAAAGVARYETLRASYGAGAFTPFFMNQVGAALVERERIPEAITWYEIVVAAHPGDERLAETLRQLRAR